MNEKPAGRAPGCGQGGRTSRRVATAASGHMAERLPEEGTKDRQPQKGGPLQADTVAAPTPTTIPKGEAHEPLFCTIKDRGSARRPRTQDHHQWIGDEADRVGAGRHGLGRSHDAVPPVGLALCAEARGATGDGSGETGPHVPASADRQFRDDVVSASRRHDPCDASRSVRAGVLSSIQVTATGHTRNFLRVRTHGTESPYSAMGGPLLRLKFGRPTYLDQLRPDKVPIVGSKVSPSDSAFRCAFDRHAVVWRERPITSSPWGHVSHVLIPQFPCQIGLRAQKINDAGNCQGKSVRLGHGLNSIMVRVLCQTMLEVKGARDLVFGYGD